MVRSGTVFIIACTLVSLGVMAQDASGDFDEEKKSAKELTKAMQNGQLLLSELSDAFDCDYVGYDVSPANMGGSTAYVVVIDVADDTCDDMVTALNYEGAKHKLAFVSEKQLPEMISLPETGSDPLDELRGPSSDYTLIHEVNPTEDQ
jgi:hypothetical protein